MEKNGKKCLRFEVDILIQEIVHPADLRLQQTRERFHLLPFLEEVLGDIQRREDGHRERRLFGDLRVDGIDHMVDVVGDLFCQLLAFTAERIFRPKDLDLDAFTVDSHEFQSLELSYRESFLPVKRIKELPILLKYTSLFSQSNRESSF